MGGSVWLLLLNMDIPGKEFLLFEVSQSVIVEELSRLSF